ncbi:MAG: CRP-like cAMP-binding protein [Verrucomicrobiales bacterium]|jgi:CRP-like cAMP-binding protein
MFKRNTPFIHPAIAETLSNELTDHEMSVLSTLGTVAELPANEIFVTEGAVGREAIVLMSGTALVSRDGETIATVGPGAILGEGALLTNEPRNASLMTTSPVTLSVLNPREFASLLHQCPRLAAKVDDLVTTRSA